MQGGQNMTIDMDARWLRVADLAAHYEVGTETVRRWAREGRIPAVRIGREIRFKPDDVRDFEANLERIEAK